VSNPSVAEQHLLLMSWTVACWMRTIEDNEIKKVMPPKDLVRFCRLFLEQEKKIYCRLQQSRCKNIGDACFSS